MACINRRQGERRKLPSRRRPACFGDFLDISNDYCENCTYRIECSTADIETLRLNLMEAYEAQSELAENPAPKKARKRARKPKPAPPPEKLPLRKILIKPREGEPSA